MSLECKHIESTERGDYCTLMQRACNCRKQENVMDCRAMAELRCRHYDGVLIAGSRTFTDYDTAETCLDWLFEFDSDELKEIVSGAAKGADTQARVYATRHAHKLTEIPADWSQGKSAGFKRNVQLHEYLTRFDNRICVLFWDGQSKGTAHSFELCRKYHTPCIVFLFDPGRKGCPVTNVRIL